MRKAGDILVNVINRIMTPETDTWSLLYQSWSDIVGEELKGHLIPLKIEKGTLFLEADHPGWAQIVKFREEDILRKVNQILTGAEVSKIKTTVTKN